MSVDSFAIFKTKELVGKKLSIQASGVGTNLINFTANSNAASYDIKYPDAAPSTDQVLRVDSADTTQLIWDDMSSGGMSPSIPIGKIPTVPISTINGVNQVWTDADFLKGIIKRTGSGTDTLGSVTATSLKSVLEAVYTLSVVPGTYFELIIYKDAGSATFNWDSGNTNITDASVADTFIPSTEMLAGNGMTLRFVFTETLANPNPGSINRVTVYNISRVV